MRVLNCILRYVSSSSSKIEFAFDGPTIIYCPTKKKTEVVAQALRGNSFFIAPLIDN